MKTSNVQTTHPMAIIRGWVDQGIILRDGGTGADSIRDLTVIGGTITYNSDGSAILTIGGSGGSPGSGFVDSDGGGGYTIYTNATSGSALTLDMSSATIFDITLTADCTLTFINPPADGEASLWIFILRQDATGGWTVTWPAAVQWQDTDGTAGASAPTLYTAPTAEDVFHISTLDGGTTYGGGQERAGGGTTATDTNIWRPVTAYDGTNWHDLVGGDGTAIMSYGPA